MKKNKILYAEDNPDDIELTLEAFKNCNIYDCVDIVNDGEELLDYLFYRNKYTVRDKLIPALLLLDLKMPKLNGLETLKAIRRTAEYKYMPVVMLSSSKIESDIIESYDLGINGFVIKPIDFKEYVNSIHCIYEFWITLNSLPY